MEPAAVPGRLGRRGVADEGDSGGSRASRRSPELRSRPHEEGRTSWRGRSDAGGDAQSEERSRHETRCRSPPAALEMEESRSQRSRAWQGGSFAPEKGERSREAAARAGIGDTRSTRQAGGEENSEAQHRRDGGTAGSLSAAGPRSDQNISVKLLKRRREELISSHFGYTNENNPFGDTTLSEPFVWRKKLQYEKAAGQDVKATPASLLATAEAKVTEIEAVKQRREEREKEEAMLEEQRELMAREREQENYEDWYKKEGLFHREMALKKTEIRLEEGRCKAIDFIIKGLRIILGQRFHDAKLLDLPPYHSVYEFQTVTEVEEFERDVKLHIGPRAVLDIDLKFSTFWESLIVVARDAVQRLRKSEKGSSSIGSDASVPDVIRQDVELVLLDKTPDELFLLEREVQDKLARMDEDTDPTFWEAIQQHLPVFKARAEILRVHRLAHQVADSMIPLGAEEEEGEDGLSGLLMQEQEVDRRALREKAEAVSRRVEKEVNPNHDGFYSPKLEPYDDDDASVATAEYHTGMYSPRLHSYDEFKSHLSLVDPLDERRQRMLLKRRITEQQRKRRGLDAPKPASTGGSSTNDSDSKSLDPSSKTMSYDEFVRREKKVMADDEEILPGSTEEQIRTHYDWEDKYRPRKPRFFNRIKTGYEWNKYNQTHYEHDNPPPKTVQGYKFNIFYPDLIDKTCTPTWKLEPSDVADTIVLRFHAGPPYEDIAFRIVNREWNMDRRRGYRNTFDKGILQLYFHFKRYQYRR